MSHYFDNAATTYLYDEVIDMAVEMMKNHWYNPNSLYSLGAENRQRINQARDIVAHLLFCKPEEIFFTGSASEGNAFVINNFKHCLATVYNHHDVKDNKKVTVINSKDNIPEFIERENTLYAMPFINNETGEIYDVVNLAKRAHELGMKILVDGTQALGNVWVKPHDLDVDFMTFSMHKVHGPKVGILYISEDIQKQMKLEPLIYGTQELHLRGSTEDTANIVASALALNLAYNEMDKKATHCEKIRNIIKEELEKSDVDFIVNEGEINSPCILNLCFKDVLGDVMMLNLDSKGYYVSVGAACDSGNLDPSEVLTAMGVSPNYIQGEMRISMSLQNSEQDVKDLAKAIIDTYHELTNRKE